MLTMRQPRQRRILSTLYIQLIQVMVVLKTPLRSAIPLMLALMSQGRLVGGQRRAVVCRLSLTSISRQELAAQVLQLTLAPVNQVVAPRLFYGQVRSLQTL